MESYKIIYGGIQIESEHEAFNLLNITLNTSLQCIYESAYHGLIFQTVFQPDDYPNVTLKRLTDEA